MGKISLGILGIFSGKVGNVVGGNWELINYMRAKATSVSNPCTNGQINQRTKLALVLAILKPITIFLRVCYKKYAIKQTAFNAAMFYILNNAFTCSYYADCSVDLAKELVSRGNLTWDDNFGSGTAINTDKALIVVLNPTRAESLFDSRGNQRVSATEDIYVQANWVDENVEVLPNFITADGKEVTNSVYLGSVTIA